MQVEVLEGDYKGISFQIDYGNVNYAMIISVLCRAMKFMWK